ncbi:MAG: GYD domain-containing protein [Planctomycetes bacterium]|nr:GYD domain-containing protein [Planctomycetota bacterium]MBI3848407.1 GYD domain-containing protein [Planctomycetota bacterium]
MAKYLWTVAYTIEGAKGLLKEGASGRRTAVEKLVQSAGGKIEAFYYSLGDADAYLIVELPDDVSAAALSLTVSAGGGANIKTARLLSIEEFDIAAKKKLAYRPPGA